MNEPCEKWEDSPLACTYTEFGNFMIKQIIRIEGRKRMLATANIANLVENSTKQATEILSGELLVQVEEMCALRAQIERNTVGDGVPSLVNTGTLSIMSSVQYQAMKVEIDSLKAVVATAAAATTTTTPNNHKKDKCNDNDIAAKAAHPYKQRPVRRYTHDNYCHTCGFDIAEIHSSTHCKWKGKDHNVLATITNQLGGTSKNCFHYKGNFTV